MLLIPAFCLSVVVLGESPPLPFEVLWEVDTGG